MDTKKILNISALVLTVAGVLFKIEHWPGANILIILSGLTMLLTLFMFGIKDNNEAGINNTLNYVMIGTLAIWIVGGLFKILHWEGATIFLYAGYALALVIPIALIFANNNTKISRQFIITFFTFFLLFIGLIRNNPIAENFGLQEKSAATEMSHDSTSAATDLDK